MNNFLAFLVNDIVANFFKDAPEIEDLGDIFIGGNGDDNLKGGDKDDIFLASGGDDIVRGGGGTDVVFAGSGDDTVIGQTGNDVAFLGGGDDRFIWNNGDGSDFIDGGRGFDVTQVNGANGAGDEFDLRAVDGQAIFNRLNLGPFTLTNEEIEQFEINGKGGDDSLTVGELSGTDVEKVIFKGGKGDDVLDARESSTTIEAIGGIGDDLLLGGSAEDRFVAGNGDDIVVGQRGDDTALLGSGDDRFIWNNGDGSDLINGGAGFDITQVNGADEAGDEFELRRSGGRTLFNRLNLGQFTLTNKQIEQFEINGQGGDDSLTVGELGSKVQKVIFSGGDGNDLVDARESSTTLEAFGGDGDDLLLGGSVEDTFFAGSGDDIVVGQRGDDTAYLQAGDDRFIWNNGDGSDFINGGDGFDVTQVNGADAAGDEFDLRAVDGQAIFNRLNLGLFTLTNEEIEQFEINGQGGDDSFTVGDLSGSDVQSVVFSGGDGNDFLNASGTATPITAEGGDGDDILIGGTGNDILIGGNGDDLLINGGGDDFLVGGAGADIFIIGGDGISVIEDFNFGEDSIQFQLSSLPQARLGSVGAMRDSLTYSSQNGAIALDGVQIATLKNPVEGFDVSTHVEFV